MMEKVTMELDEKLKLVTKSIEIEEEIFTVYQRKVSQHKKELLKLSYVNKQLILEEKRNTFKPYYEGILRLESDLEGIIRDINSTKLKIEKDVEKLQNSLDSRGTNKAHYEYLRNLGLKLNEELEYLALLERKANDVKERVVSLKGFYESFLEMGHGTQVQMEG